MVQQPGLFDELNNENDSPFLPASDISTMVTVGVREIFGLAYRDANRMSYAEATAIGQNLLPGFFWNDSPIVNNSRVSDYIQVDSYEQRAKAQRLLRGISNITALSLINEDIAAKEEEIKANPNGEALKKELRKLQGSSPLIGERASGPGSSENLSQDVLGRTASWSFRQRLLTFGRCARTASWPLRLGKGGVNPPCRCDCVGPQFSDTPDRVSPCSRQSWCGWTSNMRFLGAFLMRPADVVRASHERHSCLQRFSARRCMTACSCERGKTFSNGSIQTLTKSGGAFRPSVCEQHQLFGFLMRSSGHVACDFHHPLCLGVLDHRGTTEIRPCLPCTSSSTCALFPVFPKRTPDPFWRGGKAIGTDKETVHVWTAGMHVLQETIHEVVISMVAHGASQPEPCRHIHCQSSPHHALSPCGSDFIGVHLLALDLACFHTRRVNLLTLLSCSFVPGRSCSFIEPEGMDNGLPWTPRGKEGHHHRSLLFLWTQSFKEGAFSCTPRLCADLAPGAWPFATVNTARARPSFASCGTRRIRATWL